MLKKTRAVHFSTGHHAGSASEAHISWRPSGLQGFQSSEKMLFDFPEKDGLAVQAMVQVFAAQQGGETPGNLYPSFSSTLKRKRKMVHIEFDPDDHKSDQCELVRNIKQSLCDRGLLDVFVGWEHTCRLPEDTYIMTFTSTD